MSYIYSDKNQKPFLIPLQSNAHNLRFIKHGIMSTFPSSDLMRKLLLTI